MSGFRELNDALTRIAGRGNFGVDYELQKRLQGIGEQWQSLRRVSSRTRPDATAIRPTRGREVRCLTIRPSWHQ
jgi:hypothetical protein